MTPKEKLTLAKTIKDNITALKNQILNLEEKTKPISPDCSLGRLTRLEAMGEQDVANKVLDEARLRLTRLNNAQLHIDTPMFGICIECEEDIGFGRMHVRPESIRCVKCANNQ